MIFVGIRPVGTGGGRAGEDGGALQFTASDPGGGAEVDRIDVDSLYRRYLQAVFAYVSRHVRNPTEAEDVTAEVFVAAAVELSRYRGDGGYYAWLLGIARRKMVDLARRRDRNRELLHAELTAGERETLGLLLTTEVGKLPETAVQHKEARFIMNQLLSSLPDLQRDALLLQVVDQLSIREIASVIGRSEAATNSLLQRARAALLRKGQEYFRG